MNPTFQRGPIMHSLRSISAILALLLISTFPMFAQHFALSPEPTYHGSDLTYCAACHGDSTNARFGKVPPWSHTLHATAYDSIPVSERAFLQSSSSCLPCHTTGWDSTKSIGGFSDFFRHSPQTHADTLGMFATRNIQCEECHSPYTTAGVGYDTSLAASKCGICHGGDPHTPIYNDWQQSMHAVSKYTSSGTQKLTATNTQCAGCHTAEGAIQWFAQTGTAPKIVVGDTSKTVQLTCAGCHDPHGSKNEHQLRLPLVQICEKCHNPEYPSDSVATVIGTAVHNTPAFMFEGVGGYQYPGWYYPSSAHTHAATQKCVTCHVHTVTPANVTINTPVYTGHSFVPRKEACEGCHSDIDTSGTNFNYRRTQTITDSIAAVLGAKLATAKTKADSSSLGFLRANFNYNFYEAEGSHGIHNTSYAQALLISAIANFSLTGVQVAQPGVPFTYDLKQNFPNPFNPSTTIDFSIAGKDFVQLQVFDILGKLVTTLVSDNMTPGKYKIIWRGDDRKGQMVASGMYFYRLQAGSFTSIKKMLLLK